jgi:hypothetical protein
MKWIVTLILVLFVIAGCNRGDIQVSSVLQGQPAPHRGYNIGPGLWVETGQPVLVTGAIVWIEGTDPNQLFE